MARHSMIRSAEIVFIDPAVSNLHSFLAGLRACVESVLPDIATAARPEFSGALSDRPGINIIRIGAFCRSGEIGHGWANAPSHAQLGRGVIA